MLLIARDPFAHLPQASEFRDSYLSRNSPNVEPPRADVFSGPTTSSDRRAAKQCDELAAVHSITSSARASRVSGTSMPSVLAVLRLITSSNLPAEGLAASFVRPSLHF
jgi:hypothetical protein